MGIFCALAQTSRTVRIQARQDDTVLPFIFLTASIEAVKLLKD